MMTFKSCLKRNTKFKVGKRRLISQSSENITCIIPVSPNFKGEEAEEGQGGEDT
jgi:hypothetical protein